MKKEVALFICLFLFFTLTTPLLKSVFVTTGDIVVTGETITGETVTGDVTASSDVSIEVDASPTLTIEKPRNKTYSGNRSLRLNFKTNGDHVWFNLDGGANTTLTAEEFDDERKYFDSPSTGTHTIFVYANNSLETTVKNVSFTIDNSLFTIYNYEIEDSKRGNSTNFSIYDYEQMQNLSDIIFEHTSYGKINFNEIINLTDDSNHSDGIIDMDKYINISSNRIEIDSDFLPNFNKEATLTLSGLTFTDPRILRDGSVCSSDICTENSYSGGTLSFNVTGFTIYSSEETPGEVAASTTGGGGVRRAIIPPSFKIVPDQIKVKIDQNEKISREIIISNNGTKDLDFNITEISPSIKKLIKINEKNFTLKPGELKIISVDILAGEEISPNLYMGDVKFETGNLEKEVQFIIEVESEQSLFDVELEIPDKYLHVSPGEEITGKITLYNLGGGGKIDVFLEYTILNEDGEEIIHRDETVAVETSASFVRSFLLPKDLEEGRYFLYIKTTYNGEIASASAQFNVGYAPLSIRDQILYTVIGIVIVLGIIILFEITRLKKHVKRHHHKHKNTKRKKK